MLNAEGFTAEGLERKATCTALFKKMLYLTECEALLDQGSEAASSVDLRKVRRGGGRGGGKGGGRRVRQAEGGRGRGWGGAFRLAPGRAWGSGPAASKSKLGLGGPGGGGGPGHAAALAAALAAASLPPAGLASARGRQLRPWPRCPQLPPPSRLTAARRRARPAGVWRH
jgi:hypothetical protein